MNTSAFVISAAAAVHNPLAAKPFLCGRSPVRSARLSSCAPRFFPRFVACAQPTDAAKKEQESSDVTPEISEEVNPQITDAVTPEISEEVNSQITDAVASQPIEPTVEDTQIVAEASQPVVEETEPVPEETKPAESVAEPVVESVVEPVAESVAEGTDSETAPPVKTERRRRRRTRAKREVTLPFEKLEVGMELEGTVKSVTDYGAFVGEMGTPTDGLLHVSQLAAGFVENVSDVVSIGQKVKVRVLAFDIEKGNISLTMKTAEELEANARNRISDQEQKKANREAKREELTRKWAEFKFNPETFVDARVTSITDFGGFCQLLNEDGEVDENSPTEGLIHISELSKERVENVGDILQVGQVLKVRVVSVDRKRSRISMSLKPFEQNDKSEDSKESNLAKDLEAANSKQPEFKTSFELAFERAKAFK